MALIKKTCEQGETLDQMISSAFLWDDVNLCWVLNVDADSTPLVGSTAEAKNFTNGIEVFPAGTLKSITFVVLTGTISFDGVAFPVGTYNFNEPNGTFILNLMTIDTTLGTGFFMKFS